MHLKPITNYRHLLLIGGYLCCTLLSACSTDSTVEPTLNEAPQMQSIMKMENKSLINRWIEARNTNDLEGTLRLWTNDRHEGLSNAFNRITEAFPDVQIIADEMLADSNKVVLRWTFKATHQGAYQDIPATGKTVTWDGIDIYTIADGKIAALNRAADWSVLMVQLSDDWRPQSMPYYQQFSPK